VTRNGYTPTFSVVVCTRERPRQLDQCIAALARLDYPSYDVVIVDNAPHDDRSRDVALRWGVRYLTELAPGLSRARNCGARACETELVAYIDDDAIAEPDWLTVLARDFEDPLVAAVTGAILPTHPDTEEEAFRSGGVVPCSTGRGHWRVVDRETSGWFEIANFGGMGDGSNMAFRRSVFDVWPGFEESLGRGTILNGGEEHYAFFTLIERGYRMVYDPAAVVRHPHPRTIQELRNRHLSLIATVTAYVTRLAVEHPSCRRSLARYLLDRLRGTERPWMDRPARTAAPIVPRWLTLLTMLSGPWIYARSRMARQTYAERCHTQAGSFKASPVTGSR
jgi:glycosyltransferase involved in cell wall biosynthesis